MVFYWVERKDNDSVEQMVAQKVDDLEYEWAD
jgi:hypothetical protein